MNQVLQDIRIAFRLMRRRPLVTLSVVAILGAGIGANTAIFRVFSATFLRPLPFANEDALVRLFVAPAAGGARISPRTDVFVGLRDHARSFAGIVGQRFMDMTLPGPAGPERVTGIAVTEGWAATLGVRPFLGRAFQPDEARLGLAAPVTVISYAAWRDRFGADPGIVGREVRLDGRPRLIIGVMPPGLRYPYEADFWVPMVPGDDADAVWGYNIQARLRDGVTLAAARAELATLSTQLPAVQRLDGMTLVAFPLRELLVGDDGRMVGVLLVAVGFLLLIVSANVAHLMLAESLLRRQEFALRMALGATRGRTLRQLLTEGCVVGLLGGGVGLGIALAAESLLRVLLPPTLTQIFASTPLDGRVFLFTLAASVATGVVAGMVPAAWVSRRAPHAVLRTAGRGAVRGGLGRMAPALIVGELALALMLLSGAGMLLQDLARRQELDLGYRADHLLTLNVALTSARYAQGVQRRAFLSDALAGIRGLPEVEAAAAVTTFPAEGQGTFLSSLEFEGRPPRDAPVIAHSRLASDAFFGTMGIPVLRGRAIEPTDGPEAPAVAVVSRSLADRHWPGQDPIGQRLRERRADGPGPWRTVVGVVEDLHEFYAETAMAWYVPFAQEAQSRDARQAVFVVRTPAASGAVARQVRDAIGRVDAELAVFDVADAAALYHRSLAARRSAGLLVALFAGVGLLVASFGVYASVAFAVGARSRETAVRMAVGADAGRIVRAFVRQGALMVALGLALGGLGAAALSRWMAGVTEGGRVTPALGLGAAAVLSVVALLASYLPARRAARTDPAAVLRAG